MSNSPGANAGVSRRGFPDVQPGVQFQAVRVPIEHYASFIPQRKGTVVSPLTLIMRAVFVTRHYSVFTSKLVDVLIEYKWTKYVRRIFIQNLLFYVDLFGAGCLVQPRAVADGCGHPLADLLGSVEGSSLNIGLFLGWGGLEHGHGSARVVSAPPPRDRLRLCGHKLDRVDPGRPAHGTDAARGQYHVLDAALGTLERISQFHRSDDLALVCEAP
eukprot:1445035-Prymnesium_polylepis.1